MNRIQITKHIEGFVLEKGSELPSVTYLPYIIEDSPPLEISTEMCPKIEVPTRYYGEIKDEFIKAMTNKNK